jgi:RecQ-mediated genome instability protein 1
LFFTIWNGNSFGRSIKMANEQAVSMELAGNDLPKPHTGWLTPILSAQRANTSLKSVAATVKHRLLAADITKPQVLDPSAVSFPPNINDPSIRSQRLAGPFFVQVRDIEDLSRSRWEQIELIEAQERGEGTRGREVIRVVAEDMGENGQPATTGLGAGTGVGGPHKLVLQDWRGISVFGMELKNVPKVGLGMGIGSKLVLKNVEVARGMILLEPSSTTVVGGKIEELHRSWLENRKKDLKEAIDREG